MTDTLDTTAAKSGSLKAPGTVAIALLEEKEKNDTNK